MMIRWWEHSQKGVTDGQTDGTTDWTIHRAAWSQLKTIGHLFYATSGFVHHFIGICEFKMELQSGTAKSGSKSAIFLSRVTLIFDGWPWKTTGHLFYATSSFVHYFIAIHKFQLELQSGNGYVGFWPLWPWPLTFYMDITSVMLIMCSLERIAAEQAQLQGWLNDSWWFGTDPRSLDKLSC